MTATAGWLSSHHPSPMICCAEIRRHSLVVEGGPPRIFSTSVRAMPISIRSKFAFVTPGSQGRDGTRTTASTHDSAVLVPTINSKDSRSVGTPRPPNWSADNIVSAVAYKINLTRRSRSWPGRSTQFQFAGQPGRTVRQKAPSTGRRKLRLPNCKVIPGSLACLPSPGRGEARGQSPGRAIADAFCGSPPTYHGHLSPASRAAILGLSP